jgi:hypothetical protein
MSLTILFQNSDVALLILQLINGIDLIPLRRVCKRWIDLITRVPARYDFFCEKDPTLFVERYLPNTIWYRLPWITTAPKLPNLEHLEVGEIRDPTFFNLQCFRLTYLKTRGITHGYVTSNDVVSHLTALRHLESLCMTVSLDSYSTLTCFQYLEHLDVDVEPGVVEQLPPLLSQLTNLRYIYNTVLTNVPFFSGNRLETLSFAPQDREDIFTQLPKLFPNVSAIVTYPIAFSFSVGEALSRLSLLTSLTLLRRYSAVSVPVTVFNISQLHRLSLFYPELPSPGDPSWNSLCQYAHLTYLYVTLWKMQLPLLEILLSHCPVLKKLSLKVFALDATRLRGNEGGSCQKGGRDSQRQTETETETETERYREERGVEREEIEREKRESQ